MRTTAPFALLLGALLGVLALLSNAVAFLHRWEGATGMQEVLLAPRLVDLLTDVLHSDGEPGRRTQFFESPEAYSTALVWLLAAVVLLAVLVVLVLFRLLDGQPECGRARRITILVLAGVLVVAALIGWALLTGAVAKRSDTVFAAAGPAPALLVVAAFCTAWAAIGSVAPARAADAG